jgi:DNA-directed RNA polymerase subunit RPC12/RpoP
MRCVKCDANITGKKGTGFPAHCPACGHQVVTRPRVSGLADRQIQIAIDRVSADGSVFFLREHAGYELQRMRRRSRKNVGWLTIGLLGLGSLAVALAAWPFFGIVAPIVIVLGWIVWAIVRMRSDEPDFPNLVDAFEAVNPSPCRIKTEGYDPGERRPVDGEPDPTATGRVLICDRQAYVDFYLINEFDIRAACAVVCGRDRPSERDREVIARLKRMPDVQAFLVHDLTPHGLAMERNIRESSRWFGGRRNLGTYDLGLGADQAALLNNQLRSLSDIPGSGEGRLSAKGVPAGKGAELTIFRPARLLNMTLHCIERRKPFHEVDKRPAGDGGGDGGAMGGGEGIDDAE